MKSRIHFALIAAFLGVLALGATAAGCFSTPKPECAFLCGSAGECPADYFCASDGACKRVGLLDTFDCGFRAPPDAAVPSDAAPDAPADATPDAAIDAAIDAA